MRCFALVASCVFGFANFQSHLLFEAKMKSCLLILFVAVFASCSFRAQNCAAQSELKTEAGSKWLPVAGEAFQLNGHDAFVILPEKVSADLPWVWYAPTLNRLPGPEETWMIERFQKAGIALAGIDVGESYGSPTGRAIYDQFYKYLVESRKFSNRPVLLARSRGGLMLYSWATKNPQHVGGIAGIYPVCNIASYPGLARACGAFGLSASELREQLEKFNPINQLAPLAAARVPIFHIHGDNDTIVPLKENSAIVAKRYKELGGKMTLEVVPGQGHNMWSGWFKSEALVNFVKANAIAATENVPQTGADSEHPVPDSDLWLTYSGKAGPGRGRHVVLIAADQEYRSEQSLPMLARVLSQHHGFDCTVLFSVNENGEVDPTLPAPFKDKTKRHNIPGLKYLAKADCVIWLSRFMQLPEEQMQHFYRYFDSGKPLIALRTANHGFFGRMNYKKDGKTVSLDKLLGGSFRGHHGGWHRESTEGIVVEENKAHPILAGVKRIWGTSDVYRCHTQNSPFPADCTSLVLGQPLMNLEPDAKPNTKKEPLPVAWTKTWTGNSEKPSRIFHFTMGSAEDFANEGVRRITVNAVYWGLKMEQQIDANRTVEIVGDYKPMKAGFNYKKLGVAPHKPAFFK